MTRFTNNAEGAASGTTVTTTNSDDNGAGNAFSSTTGGTRIYDGSWSHSGATSFKIDANSAVAYHAWNLAGTNADGVWRGYIKMASYPNTGCAIFQFRNSGGTASLAVLVQPDGRLTTSVGGFSSAAPLSVDTKYRIEVKMHAGDTASGALAIAYYLGDSLTPVESFAVSALNTNANLLTIARFGRMTAAVTDWPIWFDDIVYDDGGTEFIGSTLRTFTNNAEGGAAGTDITVANSDDNGAGDPLALVPTAGLGKYDDTWKHSGSTSFKTTGNAVGAILAFAASQVYRKGAFRGYFRLAAAPGGNCVLIQFRWTGGAAAYAQVASSRLVSVGVFGGSLWTGSIPMAVDTTYRFELTYDQGDLSTTGGSVHFAYYVGDSMTPVESFDTTTANLSGLSQTVTMRWGKLSTTGDSTIYSDDVAFADGSTEFIGPTPPDMTVLSSGVEKPAVLSVWSGGVEKPVTPELFRT